MGLLKHTFNCLVCGRKAKSKHSGSKYCSNACKQKAHRDGITDELKSLRKNEPLLRNSVTSLQSENEVLQKKDVILKNVTAALHKNAEVIKQKKYHLLLHDTGLFCPLCGFYKNLCVCTDNALEYQDKIIEMRNSDEYKEWKQEYEQWKKQKL